MALGAAERPRKRCTASSASGKVLIGCTLAVSAPRDARRRERARRGRAAHVVEHDVVRAVDLVRGGERVAARPDGVVAGRDEPYVRFAHNASPATACPAPINATASAALCCERVRTSWISNTRARAHMRPHARPTLPEPMMLSVLTSVKKHWPRKHTDHKEQGGLVFDIAFRFQERGHQFLPLGLEPAAWPLGACPVYQ